MPPAPPLCPWSWVGEAQIRQRLEVGGYRSKKWKGKRPVMLRWLAR